MALLKWNNNDIIIGLYSNVTCIKFWYKIVLCKGFVLSKVSHITQKYGIYMNIHQLLAEDSQVRGKINWGKRLQILEPKELTINKVTHNLRAGILKCIQNWNVRIHGKNWK